MKKVLLNIFLLFVFTFAATTSNVLAITLEDLQLLIDEGIITVEQAKGAQKLARVDTTGILKCTQLRSNLFIGSEGGEVKKLQFFLRKKGYFDHSTDTGYYGPKTQEAVQTFQRESDIVYSGSPATTGYGAVGPQTRLVIERQTCVDNIGTSDLSVDIDDRGDNSELILGSDLDNLFNYDANFDYELSDGGDINFDYEPNFAYDYDFEYELTEYEPNFEYDAGTDYDYDFDYDVDFDYELDEGQFARDPESEIAVRVGVVAENGGVVFSEGRRLEVELATRTAKIYWESRNADSCELVGDFPQRRIDIPEDGDVEVFLVNPSYSKPRETDDDDFGIFNSDPLFGFTVRCQDDELYGDSNSDSVFIFLDAEAIRSGLPSPSISGIAPNVANEGTEITIIGLNFSNSGNDIELTNVDSGTSRTIGNVTPNSIGSLVFDFPFIGETGAYDVVVRRNDNDNTSGTATITIQ